MSEPSSAHEPMLDPAGPAKAVPPIKVTNESRAGTLPSSLSAALKQRPARPVWKKSSPISTNIGIGTSAKLVIAPKPLLITWMRSEEHTSELQSQSNLVCRLLLEKKKSA